MNKKRMSIGILLMALGISACLAGCQNVPPPAGYNCKTQNGWWGQVAGGTYNTVLDAPGSSTTVTPAPNGNSSLGEHSISGSADSYMLTWSDSRYYTAEELSSLSLWELQIARNEIYARHGVRFGHGAVQDHFLTRSWYNATVDMSQFDTTSLNAYETANIAMIQSVEAARAQ